MDGRAGLPCGLRGEGQGVMRRQGCSLFILFLPNPPEQPGLLQCGTQSHTMAERTALMEVDAMFQARVMSAAGLPRISSL